MSYAGRATSTSPRVSETVTAAPLPAPPETVGELLRRSSTRLTESGSDTARLDSELLLGHVLHVDRATLLAGPEAGVGADAAREFDELVERRASGEPVSYIRGLKEFYGLVFAVDTRALIPRPETETLVDLALARISDMLTISPRSADHPLHVWDIGTGSGCIAVALAVQSRKRGYAPDIRIRATDASAAAVSLAVENAVFHGVADAIDFAVADLTDAPDKQPVELLLANLPYIPTATVPTLPVAASFEPTSALDGGPDGLDLIRQLISHLPQALVGGGVALLEIGADQSDAVVEAVEKLGEGWNSAVHEDLGARPRVVEITR
jgi:release factor glutamine methyltransferase